MVGNMTGGIDPILHAKFHPITATCCSGEKTSKVEP